MTGIAKEHLDLWEADHDPTSAKKTYEELLNKVKDYARRRKLDTNSKERTQQGGDPADVGAVAGWEYDCDQDGVYAIGFKGKGRTKEAKEEKAKERINRAFLARVPPAVQRRRQRTPRRMLQLRRSWTSSPRVPQEQRR